MSEVNTKVLSNKITILKVPLTPAKHQDYGIIGTAHERLYSKEGLNLVNYRDKTTRCSEGIAMRQSRGSED